MLVSWVDVLCDCLLSLVPSSIFFCNDAEFTCFGPCMSVIEDKRLPLFSYVSDFFAMMD